MICCFQKRKRMAQTLFNQKDEKAESHQLFSVDMPTTLNISSYSIFYMANWRMVANVSVQTVTGAIQAMGLYRFFLLDHHSRVLHSSYGKSLNISLYFTKKNLFTYNATLLACKFSKSLNIPEN